MGTPAFPNGQRSLAGADGLPRACPAHPRTALPPRAPGRGQGTAPARSGAPSSLKAGGRRRPALPSFLPPFLPPSRDARAPQRAAAAPPACAPRPAAAWSASAARVRAGGSGRCGPSTWVTFSSPARPTPACSPWASGDTIASAASPGTRGGGEGGPCGREGPREATCAASAQPRPGPAARPAPPHACPL